MPLINFLFHLIINKKLYIIILFHYKKGDMMKQEHFIGELKRVGGSLMVVVDSKAIRIMNAKEGETRRFTIGEVVGSGQD